jgi:hypothetical protein
MPQQFENPANLEVHRRTTAQEILATSRDAPLDALITGVGTGGHITACAEVLKKEWPNLKVFAVEPTLSPVLSGGEPGPHPIQGIGAGFIPAIMDVEPARRRDPGRSRRRQGNGAPRGARGRHAGRHLVGRDARRDRPEAARAWAKIRACSASITTPASAICRCRTSFPKQGAALRRRVRKQRPRLVLGNQQPRHPVLRLAAARRRFPVRARSAARPPVHRPAVGRHQLRRRLREERKTLGFHLSARFPFSDVVVRAASDEDVHWSLSGNPIFDERGRFLGFRGIGTDLTEQRRSEQEISRLARFDSLTGLPNRAMMRQTLDEALRNATHRQKGCALFLIDLDRFKNVNDTLGHPIGDALLRQVAERLKSVMGDHGQVGRLGGDEFRRCFPARSTSACSNRSRGR